MRELPILSETVTPGYQSAGGCHTGGLPLLDSSSTERRRLPKWLKRPMPSSEMQFTSGIIEDLRLETVCESAKCPNRTECWSQRTATFMILGNVCTRPCGFCSVPRGKTEQIELDEPDRVAEAAERLGLKHVVITCVTRDDLPDGGAEHFYKCVLAVRERTGAAVEVLTSDFMGNRAAISRVIQARPDVFNHNTETVPRLYQKVRRNADYQRTLNLLAQVKEEAPNMPTKSGLMLGLGETLEEVLDVAADLRGVGCDMLTIGQYLQPSPTQLPVERFWTPEEFDALGEQCRTLGFSMVASGPFVRSSYHAGEMADEAEKHVRELTV
ncbi:lipoyl synthase [Planctomicrobium piriforme]|uniref:Lipoyl synthase n=1 Tax=Planctomicrobium piriforme TaxID=1576369 RepID=A0A1I3BMX6_9PLAN|nr:lipoyl synthase [Planctomicrobium piriforme]SFH63622.1 lipoic acid synthetase [Planctomicrobium piriforme]